MGTRAATRAAMSGFGSRWWSRLTHPYTRMGLRAGRTVALGAGRWSKVSPRHPHDSAPARLPCLLRAPAHLAPSHCLRCSSWSPPNAVHSPLTTQAPASSARATAAACRRASPDLHAAVQGRSRSRSRSSSGSGHAGQSERATAAACRSAGRRRSPTCHIGSGLQQRRAGQPRPTLGS